jgi:hypothetical protein
VYWSEFHHCDSSTGTGVICPNRPTGTGDRNWGGGPGFGVLKTRRTRNVRGLVMTDHLKVCDDDDADVVDNYDSVRSHFAFPGQERR